MYLSHIDVSLPLPHFLPSLSLEISIIFRTTPPTYLTAFTTSVVILAVVTSLPHLAHYSLSSWRSQSEFSKTHTIASTDSSPLASQSPCSRTSGLCPRPAGLGHLPCSPCCSSTPATLASLSLDTQSIPSWGLCLECLFLTTFRVLLRSHLLREAFPVCSAPNSPSLHLPLILLCFSSHVPIHFIELNSILI